MYREMYEEAERKLDRLLAALEVQNLRGTSMRYHDDQRRAEQRVIDHLEGNTLIHPLTTPVIEADQTGERARAVFTSLGYEGLSIYGEEPMAIWSAGYIPGTHEKKQGKWEILTGVWQRTVKAKVEKGWIHDMQKSNCRPPLTDEEDRQYLGRYAYRKEEARVYVPVPPDKHTWRAYPDTMDERWYKGEEQE